MPQLQNNLIFGCHSLATMPTSNHALELIQQAWRLGFRDFDTAPLYSRGYSEILLGQALKAHSGARLTTKVGHYTVPRTFLYPALALPLHWIKRKLIGRLPKSQVHSVGLEATIPYIDSSSIESHVLASLGRLQVSSVDTLLLHEVSPFALPFYSHLALTNLILSRRVLRLGYGGIVPLNWLQQPLPAWLTVMQLLMPVGDDHAMSELEKFIERYPEKEIRLFGVFRTSNSALSVARVWLRRYQNCRVVFSCRSYFRLKANTESLLG